MDFLNEWIYDFKLFKNECKDKDKYKQIKLSKESIDYLKNKIKEKLLNLKDSYLYEKKIKTKEKDELQKEQNLKKKIEEVNKISLKAIEKQLKLEQLLEEDELSKEEMQQEELRKEISSNEKKSEKLIRAIKEKQLEEKYNLAKYNAIESIKKIKEETEKQILMRRLVVKKRVTELRKLNERKKSLLKEELLNIRGKMAENLTKATKKGDSELCSYSVFKLDLKKINSYCTSNFKENIQKHDDCVKEEYFCGICCENELGELYLTEREICNKQCKAPKSSFIQKETIDDVISYYY